MIRPAPRATLFPYTTLFRSKNLYLDPSRNPFRKVEEYFIARSLEKHLTKKRILELYLNVVEMGERVYGAEAAARSEEHTSELQSRFELVCRLLLEKQRWGAA